MTPDEARKEPQNAQTRMKGIPEVRLGILAAPEIANGAALLARAFADDPVLSYFLSPGAEQRTAFRAFFRSALWEGAPFGCTHAAWVRGRLAGVALWVPPVAPGAPADRADDARSRSNAALRSVRRRYPDGLPSLLEGFEALAGYHPHQPHWYLAFVGVEPSAQGNGIGRQLLAPQLLEADGSGLPSYLETPFPATHPFYRSLGFAFHRELRTFGPAPAVSSFLRAPK